MDHSNNAPLGIKLATDDRFAYNTLIHVFKYLDFEDLFNCSKVCPMWKWIVLDDSLWKNLVEVSCCSKHANELELFASKIKRLDLLNASHVPYHSFEELCTKMTNLLEIHLYGEASVAHLRVLAKNNPKLERLSTKYDLPDYDNNIILLKLNNLTHLEVNLVDSRSKIRSNHFELMLLSSLLRKVIDLSLITGPLHNSVWREIARLDRLKCLNLNMTHDPSKTEAFSYSMVTNNHLRSFQWIQDLTIKINRPNMSDTIQKIAQENYKVFRDVVALRGTLKYLRWIVDEFEMIITRNYFQVPNAIAFKRYENDVIAPISLQSLLSLLKRELPYTEVTVFDSRTLYKPKSLEYLNLNITYKQSKIDSFFYSRIEPDKVLKEFDDIENLTVKVNRFNMSNTMIQKIGQENYKIFKGVIALKNTLKHFRWIVDISELYLTLRHFRVFNAIPFKRWEKDKIAPISLPKLFFLLEIELPYTEVTIIDSSTLHELDRLKVLDPNMSLEPSKTNDSFCYFGIEHRHLRKFDDDKFENLTIKINSLDISSSTIQAIGHENFEIFRDVMYLQNNLKNFRWIVDETAMIFTELYFQVPNAIAFKMCADDDIAPMVLPRLLSLLQCNLPFTEVTILDSRTVNNSGSKCLACDTVIIPSYDTAVVPSYYYNTP